MIYLLIKIFFLLNLFFQSIPYAYSENKIGFSLDNFPKSCEKYKRTQYNSIFGYKKNMDM